ncbi:MAG: cytochrome c3 family protein [Anaerolineales bacterium]|nr:cytochrome c3 family protein [Anaerolineales bacterium]
MQQKQVYSRSITLAVLLLSLLLATMLAGCGQEAPAPPVEITVVVTATPLPTETPPEPPPPPDHSAIVAAWEQSPHGNTYDLGKGPNTYCSRCHSPQNWDPEATTDTPPNCVTCKFPTDAELRIASTMDFVSEEDWVGINCETCHVVEDGVVQEGIAWLSPLTGEYLAANTPNELCTKCHLTSQGVSATGGRGVTHEIYLGGSAHKNWAGITNTERRPEYCSDCHDPHTQEPIACTGCHTIDETDHAMGFYPAMAETVTCMACHEASGMDVGPHPDEAMGGIWVPVVSEMSRSGQLTTSAVVSHSIQWQVSCNRCHFEENPWELPVLTENGQIPEPAEDTGG